MSGEVRMRIRGLMPEKLIERARDMDVRFRAIAPQGDHEIIVETSAEDAGKLIALCRRYSIPCEILSRRGRSALLRALRRRWTMSVGLLAAVMLCWVFLGHIWRVDIRFIGENSDRGDSAAIGAVLGQTGVYPGMPRDIDTRLLSEELLARCEGLSHVLTRVEGVRLLIEASPEAASPEIYDVSAQRDLYARESGIVVSVNVEAGEPCVRPGDTVRRGQLLIRGAERISNEETRGIAALGEVIIRTWFEGGAEGDLIRELPEPTGQISAASTLVTPWFEIPILAGREFDLQHEEADILPIGGLFLPVSIERATRRELRIRREAADTESLAEALGALAMADARHRLSAQGPGNYEIARSWTRVNRISDHALRVSAVCEITTNTAVTIEALHQGG